MIPACDRVYAYTASATSEWTTTDLLRVLRDLVHSTSRSAGETLDATDRPTS